MLKDIRISGLGYFVPPTRLTNSDLEKMVDTSDEWITSRTGIKERRIATTESCSDLGAEAARKALDQSGLSPEQITHLVVATFTPDYYCPNAACLLQQKLGLGEIPCFDVNAACSGFTYGLEMCRGLAALNPEARILLVASEVVTSRIDFQDRSTCVLFGDGAGAAVIGSGEDGCLIRDVLLRSNGSLGELLTVKGGGSRKKIRPGDRIDSDFFVHMQGREVFKYAVKNMYQVAGEILERNDLRTKDIDLILPHQANIRIIDALGKKLNAAPDQIYTNVDRYGNTSAASVPIALAEAREKGLIRDGDRVLVVAFGGGFTWGSALLEF
ncbi:MAG: beta-ketoacyl-ACP synthase III [Desulfonatronovibrionaceae bacterium]